MLIRLYLFKLNNKKLLITKFNNTKYNKEEIKEYMKNKDNDNIHSEKLIM